MAASLSLAASSLSNLHSPKISTAFVSTAKFLSVGTSSRSGRPIDCSSWVFSPLLRRSSIRPLFLDGISFGTAAARTPFTGHKSIPEFSLCKHSVLAFWVRLLDCPSLQMQQIHRCSENIS
ncbi:hypothetical protein SUGI_0322190 [Cryptomeria japonica]|nr:hypothetical protein SUGI_0322190 [Cryptomeria japonica]